MKVQDRIVENKVSYEEKKRLLIAEFEEKKSKGIISLNKKTSNLFRSREKTKKARLNVSNFNRVISIDKKSMTAEIEGMATFETIVKETLKSGLLPPVVPQLKLITLGGAISGIGIEASSFKYGLVHETVIEMDILLPNGKIVTASRNNSYSDLFFALPNSYGTLGYILRAKIKLIQAKKFVKLENKRYMEKRKFFSDIKKYCDSNEYDFIDGVFFKSDEMYITLGKFVEFAPFTSNYKYMKIFYKSIRKNKEDYLKVSDFIWRWDSDWFWTSKVFLMQNFLPRLLFGKFMLKSKSYLALKRLNEKYQITKKLSKNKERKEAVIQDVGIPLENSKEFLDFFEKNIKISPVWLCPTKLLNKKYKFPLFDLKEDKLYIDFGFWDFVPSSKPEGYYNKLIEKKVTEFKGKKSLYSESFYSEEDFKKEYSWNFYKKVKEKYDPNHVFLNLYEKCVKRK